MKNITQAQAVANFEDISQQLIASAATPKAAEFAEKTIAKIRAMGGEWILKNAQALRVTFVPGELFPVRDNRNYYLSEFQMALLNK